MRILIAEDQALLRDGMSRMLTAFGFEVVETLASGEGLAEKLVAVRPDVSVIDVRLPPTFTHEGVRAALAARRIVAGLPVLVLSQYVERMYARELLSDSAGAVGYLLKDRVGEVAQFAEAVRQVASGGTVMDPEVVGQLLDGRAEFDGLTPRELDVLRLMALGRSNAAIAEELMLAEKSVSNQINSVFSKFGLPPGAHQQDRRVAAVLRYLDRISANPPDPLE
ncbi:response regulator transcription factor [Dactylosporangium vinaceum]|uniref:Response regulator n=1 Tax=Dactylosporangium vinaceum TaxID=53362 RepID=A0ABV5LYC9_9ACTN|nr:response regulator transcription factor [Dactylosporangium vinaceum]UAB95825.1 response regulator transcription factor [Dactylosporangium vinaceum]